MIRKTRLHISGTASVRGVIFIIGQEATWLLVLFILVMKLSFIDRVPAEIPGCSEDLRSMPLRNNPASALTSRMSTPGPLMNANPGRRVLEPSGAPGPCLGRRTAHMGPRYGAKGAAMDATPWSAQTSPTRNA